MSNGWTQSTPGYLQTLKNEAAGLEIDTQSEPGVAQQESGVSTGRNESRATGGHAGAIRDLESGLTIEQFERLLKHNYMGSYLFYKRLDDAGKKEVFEFYQQNPDPKQLREKILQASKR